MIKSNPQFKSGGAAGFTLVELLVALVLSLVLLTSLVSSYVANENMTRARDRVLTAQENFRFAHYKMLRILENASSFVDPGTSDALSVLLPSDRPRCIGGYTAGAATVTFQLSVSVDTGESLMVCYDTQSATQSRIINGVQELEFTYGGPEFGTSLASLTLVSDDDYVNRATVTTWSAVKSIRARILLDDSGGGQELEFIMSISPP